MTTTKAHAELDARSGRGFWTAGRRDALSGYLFISPWILGFLIWVAFPMVASMYLSLSRYTIIKPPEFIGLENYRTALLGLDKQFWPSLGRTGYYALLNVTLGISGSLLAALLLNQRLVGTVLLRTLFFLPSLTPIVASVLLWQWIFQPEIGVLNFLLAEVGVNGPKWLQSTTWAMPSLIIMALWGGIGGSRMIIFLAGLQGVPQELYEAASIDGANWWHRFRNVTLPMLSPTIFFNMVLLIIGSFSVFSVAFIGTDGGPAYATYFYIYHLFNNAFRFSNMGYAAAMAWLFFILMLAFTFVQFRLSDRWVFYGGEVDKDGK
jgi:multiple sugar transport system permease protein